MILDIFAQNARSPEGKAQVELALLRYRLPRLRGPGHRSSASRPAASAPGGRARPSSRWTGGAWCAACTSSRPSCADVERTRGAPAAEPGPGPPARGRPGRLHQRRQVHAAQPADRRRRPGREPPLRHPRPAHPPAGSARRRDGAGDRHGGLRPQAAPRAGRGVPLHPRLGAAGRPGGPRGRRVGARRRGADRRRARRCWARSAPADVPELLVVNKADVAPDEAEALAARASRARW